MIFYKETEFKDTEIGRIPKDWEVVKIGDVFDLYKGTTPSTKVKNYWNGAIPFVTPTDITQVSNLNERYLKSTEHHITEVGLKSKGLKLVPEGSLLFTSRATIGYLAINKIKVAINQGIISLKSKNATTEVTFFYYLLQKLRDLFENLSGGSTYKEISMSTFSNINLPLPPFDEQQKIAEILSTVDDAIQKTNEIIAKTERLKKGLMHELLTKGIGHKEFKNTEIGRIPKDWEVVRLEEICEKIKAGGTPLTTKKEFWNGNIPFVKIEDITSSGKYLMQTLSSITNTGLENSNAWLVPERSLLLAMYGSLGEVSINIISVATNQAILGIIPKEKDDLEFLYYWFLYFKPYWRKFAKPTTQANLTAEIVRNTMIPLPSTQERRKIAEILSTVDHKLEAERKEKAKLERIKQGLMDLLLTGKVRVRL